MPKISVVVPVYNVERYLGRCLDSLLRQSLRDIEIICVDDGSTDGTGALLDGYAAKDARVKVYHKENAGAGGARNFGAERAGGEYLFFCDPDDWCSRRMLGRLYSNARKHDSDVVVFGAVRHDGMSCIPEARFPSRRFRALGRVFSGRDAADFLFVSAWANPWNKFVKSDFFRARRLSFQNIRRENDLYFSYCTVALAGRISLANFAGYHYRMHRAGSLQDNVRSDGQPLCWIEAWRAVKARLEEEGLLETYSLGLLRALIGTGVRSLLKHADAKAIELLYGAIREEVEGIAEKCEGKKDRLTRSESSMLESVLKDPSPVSALAQLALRSKNPPDRFPERLALGAIRLLRRHLHFLAK